MTTLVGWGTESGPDLEDRFRDTLVARAKKRVVEQAGVGVWRVAGDPKLGDSYPEYTVEQEGNTGYRAPRHHCSCQDHAGGEYRKVCSHILAVLLYKRDHDQGERAESPSAGRTGVGEGDQTYGQDNSTAGQVLVSDDRLPHVRDAGWGHPALPSWVSELRPHQIHAVVDVVEAFQRGAKVVFLDAPTGSGKTLIGECVRRMVDSQALYTCSTKTLQDQFVRDFPYAALLKGRDNYPTQYGQFPDVTAGDCMGDPCNWCESRGECPYQQAKAQALGAKLAVTNTAYTMTAWNGPGTFRKRGLVIVDECDLLESQVMGFVEVSISANRARELGIREPGVVTHTAKSAREEWARWVDEAKGRVQRAIDTIPEDTDVVGLIRKRKSLGSLLSNLNILEEGLRGEEVEWVYDGGDGRIVFKPVRVDHLCAKYLWPHGERFLLMSASIISPEEMAESLGIDDDWDVVRVPSTFPKDNRPVHVLPIANVTAKTYDDEIGKVKRAVKKIVNAHPDERVLIHTVSYRMARDVDAGLTGLDPVRRVVTYTDSYGRERALEAYKSSPNAVLVAPSMDRGVDLPGDLCRVQVIVKVPFPYLGDKQVSARLYSKGGRLWYAVQTVRTLVQMTGRGVRSKDDHATTYILDRQFKRVWDQNRRLFPEWWKEAVDWSGRAMARLGL